SQVHQLVEQACLHSNLASVHSLFAGRVWDSAVMGRATGCASGRNSIAQKLIQQANDSSVVGASLVSGKFDRVQQPPHGVHHGEQSAGKGRIQHQPTVA